MVVEGFTPVQGPARTTEEPAPTLVGLKGKRFCSDLKFLASIHETCNPPKHLRMGST